MIPRIVEVGWFHRGPLDAVIYITVVFCVGINVVADMFVMCHATLPSCLGACGTMKS